MGEYRRQKKATREGLATQLGKGVEMVAQGGKIIGDSDSPEIGKIKKGRGINVTHYMSRAEANWIDQGA